MPLDATTAATGGRSAYASLNVLTHALSEEHNTPLPSGPSIVLAKRALGPLDDTVATISAQVAHFRAEEIARRKEPVLPLGRGGNASISLSGDILLSANPYYVKDWTPTPFLLPVVGLWSGIATGDNDNIEVETGSTLIRVVLEDTAEIRSLVGALQTNPSKVRERSEWRALFEVFREPDHFHVPLPGITLLRSSRMTEDKAKSIVDGLGADGTFVEGEGGRATIAGHSEFRCEKLVLMEGDDEEGWEQVAEFSLV